MPLHESGGLAIHDPVVFLIGALGFDVGHRFGMVAIYVTEIDIIIGNRLSNDGTVHGARFPTRILHMSVESVQLLERSCVFTMLVVRGEVFDQWPYDVGVLEVRDFVEKTGNQVDAISLVMDQMPLDVVQVPPELNQGVPDVDQRLQRANRVLADPFHQHGLFSFRLERIGELYRALLVSLLTIQFFNSIVERDTVPVAIASDTVQMGTTRDSLNLKVQLFASYGSFVRIEVVWGGPIIEL